MDWRSPKISGNEVSGFYIIRRIKYVKKIRNYQQFIHLIFIKVLRQSLQSLVLISITKFVYLLILWWSYKQKNIVRSLMTLLRTILAVLYNSIIQYYYIIAFNISIYYIVCITHIPVVCIFNEIHYIEMTREKFLFKCHKPIIQTSLIVT